MQHAEVTKKVTVFISKSICGISRKALN